MIIDHYLAQPLDAAMGEAMKTAADKEHYLLAVMAGRSSLLSEEAARRVGAGLEERARLLHRGIPVITPDAAYEEPIVRGSLLERLRAVLAA
ncbi:hypothetical protein G5V59_09640 [Nocardioides sp. W3-2-3]|uniref:hypothetical protein n=1 Tax=Nocardioides convexus TaxID=2712224 RepID=UPI0024183F71|nr:hypothetical protein [Nocardioides convexus]NHA00274.1 hypothetical protein [Nocardioides convexus]